MFGEAPVSAFSTLLPTVVVLGLFISFGLSFFCRGVFGLGFIWNLGLGLVEVRNGLGLDVLGEPRGKDFEFSGGNWKIFEGDLAAGE